MNQLMTVSLLALIFTVDAFALGLKATTFNIRNFGRYGLELDPADKRYSDEKTDLKLLKKLLKDNSSDIIAVQEIFHDVNFKGFIKTHFTDYAVALSNCGGGGKQKLGFIYKKSKLKLLKTKEDNRTNFARGCHQGSRPVLMAQFLDLSNNESFWALSVHLKAGGKQSSADKRLLQYKVLGKIAQELRRDGHKKFIIMGDFNTTDYIKRNQNYDRFIEFMSKSSLVHLTDSLECSSYWWGGVNDGLEYPSLLDHIIVSKELNDSLKGIETWSEGHCKQVSCGKVSRGELGSIYSKVSDHCPIATRLVN